MMKMIYFYKVLILILISYAIKVIQTQSLTKPKVFAEVNFNRFSRKHDGLIGLWSYYGIAEKSESKIREFNFNGDFISPNLFHKGFIQRTNLATKSSPRIGLTSDFDEDYLNYLILQSNLIGIDGFLIEWGYESHQSDLVLQQLVKILKKSEFPRDFTIGINWCDNWTKMHLGKNATPAEIVKSFHENALYILKTLYVEKFSFYHDNRPVILIFGGGLTVQEFKDFLSIPLIINNQTIEPIWIGNYLNTGSSDKLREEWSPLINGTFAWVTHSRNGQKSGSKFLEKFDTYSIPKDNIEYQKEISNYARFKINSGNWSMFLSSVNPGEDNRPCAGWGQTLKYVPRYWNQSYNYKLQWNYLNTSEFSDYVLIATLNDYSESTVILPTMQNGFRDLYTTAKYAVQFKNASNQVSFKWLKYPFNWFKYTKVLDELKKTGQIDVPYIKEMLDQAWLRMNQNEHRGLEILFKKIRMEILNAKSSLEWLSLNVTCPSSSLYPIGALELDQFSSTNFSVNVTHPLRLKMNETLAQILRNNFYRGMLSFEYESQNNFRSVLKILGSNDRKSIDQLKFYSNIKYENVIKADYGVIAEISSVPSERGKVKSAFLELVIDNLNWKHRLRDGSDLVFQILCSGGQECSIILREIRIYFYVLK